MGGAKCSTYQLKEKEKTDLAALKARRECLVSLNVNSHGSWPGWGPECWDSKLPGCEHAPAVKARFKQAVEAMDKRSPEPARMNKLQWAYAGLTIVREVAEWIFQAPTPHFRAVLDQTRWPDDARLRVGIHIRWCVDCGYARMTESLVLKVGERNARALAFASPFVIPPARQNMECILKHLRDLSSKHFGGPNATTAVWLATDNPKQVIPVVRKALAKNYGPAATLLTYPNAEKLGFVHTFHGSGGLHGFEKDLYPYVDWHLLGDADAIYGCGTTYSRTAWARRSRATFAIHAHTHKGNAPIKGPACYQIM